MRYNEIIGLMQSNNSHKQ